VYVLLNMLITAWVIGFVILFIVKSDEETSQY
jgi:hypothetical protein